MAGEELPGKDFLWEYNCLYREYDSIFHDVALTAPSPSSTISWNWGTGVYRRISVTGCL